MGKPLRSLHQTRMRLTALLAMAVAGCNIVYYDENVSDPEPPGTPASVKFTRKNEASTLYMPFNGQDRVLVAYNDSSGFFEAHPLLGTQDPKPDPTNMGYSYSLDAGVSWTRHGPLPINPNCGEPVCPTLLSGNPWLATNGSRVLYSTLAMTSPNAGIADNPDAVAVAQSDDGGISWAPVRIALHDPGQFVDKPSISMFGNAAAVVATRAGLNQSPVLIATSDDAGDSWLPYSFLNVDDVGHRVNPIVRLRTATLGYVAYMHLIGDGHADLRIVRIERTGGANWTNTRIFGMENVQWSTPFVVGALGRYWKDIFPVSFDIGLDGTHLYLAFRQASSKTGSDITMLADCTDSPVGMCGVSAGGELQGWTIRSFEPSNVGQDQYQPGVATSKEKGSDTVAVTYYEEAPFADPDIQIADAEAFDGYAPPFSGEYKPDGGPCPPCGPNAWCDIDTGWCCSGFAELGKCACGEELGCEPPQVCCELDGAREYQCVGSIEQCPHPW